ncbi:alpha-hydroxy-acid oxidizing protein [Ectothiorhodospiraceae bacterium WFHF3C12]|nr:alpha-hydroxy-acid oxidizing protein [Ectothiorhodospiraceae bacterium WFHF3C12]
MRWQDLEAQARETVPEEAYWYVAGGAGEATMDANLAAFDNYRLVPRMLTDISKRDIGRSVLGKRFDVPFMFAPIGVQEIIHEEAELAVARAAAEVGVPMILSTVSSKPMEDVADALGDTPGWFQLYWPNDDELAASFVQRAEKAGYEAIVVTLDTKMMAWRERDLKGAYLPFLKGQGLSNYFTDPVFRSGLEKAPEEEAWPAIQKWGQVFAAPARTWDDLARLKAATSLPILLKGVLHPEDAKRAADCGMDGVIVSNHGGRQVDGAIAAIDALPGVVDAVGDRMAVLFDSGIRRGADVLKAVALGADAVLLGRPYVWGLAVDGQAGVAEVARRLAADVDITLALTGCDRLDGVNRSMLE